MKNYIEEPPAVGLDPRRCRDSTRATSPLPDCMDFGSLKLISSGRTSSVCLCPGHHLSVTQNREAVAIKVLVDKSKAFEEINKLLMMGHPNVMCILDSIETDEYVGIVMPLMHMDLRVFMTRVAYTAATMLQIMHQSAQAVRHVHTRGILHMDIKPENICVNIESAVCIQCKLLDFGSSLTMDEFRHLRGKGDERAAPIAIQTTKGYQAPELLSANGVLSFAGDIYSLGVVFGELVRQIPSPADGKHTASLLQLAHDMQGNDYRRRPSALDVLFRLGDESVHDILLINATPTPIWRSEITNALRSGIQNQCVADIFIDDLSTDLQKLVTLVLNTDAHLVRDAFWLLYEASIDEVDHRHAAGLSVLAILPYFESRVHIAKENAFFYTKALDILSQMSHFSLSTDMQRIIWTAASSSCACERPVIRCLSNCWSSELREWCTDSGKKWGTRQEPFSAFVIRFVDDWDAQCAQAAGRLASVS
jgi:serine/threonine protein kinase